MKMWQENPNMCSIHYKAEIYKITQFVYVNSEFILLETTCIHIVGNNSVDSEY